MIEVQSPRLSAILQSNAMKLIPKHHPQMVEQSIAKMHLKCADIQKKITIHWLSYHCYTGHLTAWPDVFHWLSYHDCTGHITAWLGTIYWFSYHCYTGHLNHMQYDLISCIASATIVTLATWHDGLIPFIGSATMVTLATWQIVWYHSLAQQPMSHCSHVMMHR